MKSRVFKIILAVIGMIMGAAEVASGTKDLVDAIKNKDEETEEGEKKEEV